MSDVAPVAGSKPVWLDDKTKSVMDRAIAREQSLSRLLMTYIVTGLVFMLLPGTFLGVWNLIKISSLEAVNSVSPAWIQAHGHAQLFGWVGTFILGIGFYSIPKLRKLRPFALREGWLCFALWVVGVTCRWIANVCPWHWRVLLPLSAVLEFAAFLIFFRAVASHRPSRGAPKPWEPWIFVVVAATLGLLTSLLLNLGASVQLARHAVSPAFSQEFDQRYLIVSTWGFLVPMVWGFSSRWLTIFMGLRPLRNSLLLEALVLNTTGVVAGFFERFTAAGAFLLVGTAAAIVAIRFFEPSAKPAKTINVHRSFPIHPHCLRMALDRVASHRVGVCGRGGSGNLGSLSACTDRRIHRRDDLLRWAESPAILLRYARVVEPAIDALDVNSVDDGLHAPSRLGNPCLSGLCDLGMDRSSGFCTPGTDCSILVRCQSHRHLPSRAHRHDDTAEHDHRVARTQEPELCCFEVPAMRTKFVPKLRSKSSSREPESIIAALTADPWSNQNA